MFILLCPQIKHRVFLLGVVCIPSGGRHTHQRIMHRRCMYRCVYNQVIGQSRRYLGLDKMRSILDLVNTMCLLSCLLFKKLDPDPGCLGNSLTFIHHTESKLCWEWGGGDVPEKQKKGDCLKTLWNSGNIYGYLKHEVLVNLIDPFTNLQKRKKENPWGSFFISSKNECLSKEVCLLKVKRDWPAAWRRGRAGPAKVAIPCPS